MDQWDPDLFDDLEQLLVRLVSQPTTSTIRRFYVQLDRAVPWITSLTQFPPPTDQEKATLASSE